MLGGSGNANREGLLGSDGCASATTSTAGMRGLDQLEATNRLAAQTEQIGATILSDLGHQRGQLENAMQRRQEAHDTLSISTRLIRQMHRRATWMKVSLCLIVAMLVGGVALIVYLHWGPGGHEPSPPAPPGPDPPGRMLSEATSASRGIGPGLIAILVVGILCLAACIVAVPTKLAVRLTVFCVSSLIFTGLLLFFFLLDIEPPPDGTAAGPTKLTNAMPIFRVLLLIFTAIFALCAMGCILVRHAVVVQRAPIVVEPEAARPYRIAKV